MNDVTTEEEEEDFEEINLQDCKLEKIIMKDSRYVYRYIVELQYAVVGKNLVRNHQPWHG